MNRINISCGVVNQGKTCLLDSWQREDKNERWVGNEFWQSQESQPLKFTPVAFIMQIKI